MQRTEKSAIDAETVKMDFPVLRRRPNGKPLVYLDSAATSQKPRPVIEALNEYYRTYNANVHRGIYSLSVEATEAFEGARKKIANFINARSASEIVFVRNTTEAINLVAYSWARSHLMKGDRIVLTEMEHHSNIVPWQILAKERGVELEFIGLDEEGKLRIDQLDGLLDGRTKLLSMTHVSNVLGTVNPVEELAKKAHSNGVMVLVDGAQSVPHQPIDVQKLNCDFLAFSGHKMLGPMGVGVLYGRREVLEEMPPFLGGGDMIREVHLRDVKFNELPWKFEAGTPSVGDAVALGVAIDYLQRLEMSKVSEYEHQITSYAYDSMKELKGMRIYGPRPPSHRGGLISFTFGDIHAHDLASILDEEGLAIRAGHHCAMPLMERLGVPATARVSFYVYNTYGDVDSLIGGLKKAAAVFGI